MKRLFDEEAMIEETKMRGEEKGMQKTALTMLKMG